MRNRIARLVVIGATLASFAALPAGALAKHGADDPVGHHHHSLVHHGHGADDRPGHR
jgi:hypothetical protein